MSKTQNETNPQNDSVDSGSITLKIGGLINRLKLFKEVGDITIVNTPLNKSDYSTALKEYDNLNTTAKKTTQFPSSADKAEFLFDLNKCQAVIAVRAGQDASTYLKAWQSANSNDFMTGLQTILEERIKFLQETGNITKINELLDSSEYTSSKSIYDSLVKTIKDYSLSDEIKTKLSFDLNKCQAISAVRANSKDASTYLKACGSISANRNDFIIELYKIINLQKKVANNVQNPELKITTQLYKPLLEQAFEVVGSFLNSNNYEAALKEIMPLIRDANTVLTLEKYVEICIKEAAPQKLEECWNQCLMTTSSTIEKSKTLAGIFQKLHDTFESLASVDPKTKAKYEDIAKQANERAIQYTPQKEEVQDKEPEKKATVTKKEKIAQKKVEKGGEKLKQAQKEYFDSVIEAEKIKNAKKAEDERLANIKKAEDELLAAIKKANEEAAAKKAKEDAEIEAQAKITLDAMQALVKKDDTSLTPTAPPKEVEASDSSNVVTTSGSSNVVTASDSSNVAETSDSSNVAAVSKFSKGYVPIYPPLDGVGDDIAADDIAADDIAASKASSSISVYNSSPFSYTAGTHQTAPIKAVMPTSRSADPTATDDKTAVEDVVEETVGTNAPNTLVDTSS